MKRFIFIFEKMKLNVNNSSLFKKKLHSLNDLDQKKVSEHIRKLATSFQNGKTFFYKNVSQPYQFKLKNNLESSLYASKVSQDIRLILSVDEDPIFDKLDVTLFDITDKAKEETRFKKIGEHMYRSEDLL